MKKTKKLLAGLAGFYAAVVLVTGVAVPAIHPDAPMPEPVQMPECSAERAECIDDNSEALLRRLQVIESAQQDLVLATYSFCGDESGQDIMGALLSAADRGVRVRILVDGITARLNLQGSPAFRALAGAPNVEVRVYNPVSLLRPWRLNYRMHDKYLIADDSVYLLGGRNTRNVSLGAYQTQADTDRDLLVYTPEPEGASIQAVRAYFESVWTLPETRAFSGRPNPAGLQLLRQANAALRARMPEAEAVPDWQAQTVPTGGIRLLTNPVRAGQKCPTLWKALCSQMARGTDIAIQTPYVVCSGGMYEDLTALSRGRTLRILTNAVETGANPNGCADYLNQRRNILASGAEVHECISDRSYHTKTILIDDRISIVGTFNLDMRSAYLDTEMMLVVDCPELNAQLRRQNEAAMARGRCASPDGTVTPGSACPDLRMPLSRRLMLGALRLISLPVRQLL